MLRHSIITHVLYNISCFVCHTDPGLGTAAMPRTLMYEVYPSAGCRCGCCMALRLGTLTKEERANAQGSSGCKTNCKTVLSNKLLCQSQSKDMHAIAG